MCFQLLFIHSIFGSAMTSRIFGVGKSAFQKLAKGDPDFNIVSTHSPPRTRQHWLYSHRGQVMAILFGRQGTHSLETRRYSTFSKKVVSTSSFVTTERLLHTYNQVTVSNVIKLFVSTIYTLSYSSPIDATSGI